MEVNSIITYLISKKVFQDNAFAEKITVGASGAVYDMEIETKRLLIRNFTETDVEALYATKYDPNVLKYNPSFLERNITKENVIDYIRKYDIAGRSVLDAKRVYVVEL